MNNFGIMKDKPGGATNSTQALTTTLTFEELTAMTVTTIAQDLEKNKVCEHCGIEIIRKKDECRSKWLKKRFCSRSCASKANKNARKNSPFKKGNKHPRWNGGKHLHTNGYVQVLVGTHKYRPEHVLIMEAYLGRKLEKCECVHHVDEVKDNNNLKNLELMLKVEHNRFHATKQVVSEKTKALLRHMRVGTNQKTEHPQWRNDINEQSISAALDKHKTKKAAAVSLGISPGTLDSRIKFYQTNWRK